MTKFHLGCGKRDFGSEWCHIDGGDFPHVHDHDITLKDWNDSVADVIYACHLFEYFDREEGLELLKAWRRVLKHGGILRLAVPDFDNMVIALSYKEFKLKDIIGPLYGRMQMGDKIIYHKTVYNYDDLKQILRSAGFNTVRRYDWRDTDHADFDDHSRAYLPKMDFDHGTLISLNVEAIK